MRADASDTKSKIIGHNPFSALWRTSDSTAVLFELFFVFSKNKNRNKRTHLAEQH